MCQVLTPKLNATVAERVHSLSLEIRHQSWNRMWLRRGSNLIASFFEEVLCESAGAKPGGRCASIPVTVFPYGSQQLQAGKKNTENIDLCNKLKRFILCGCGYCLKDAVSSI